MSELVELKELPKEIGTEFVLVYEYGPQSNIGTVLLRVEEYEYSRKTNKNKRAEFSLSNQRILKILARPHAELQAKFKNNGSKVGDWKFRDTTQNEWLRFNQEDANFNWLPENEYMYNPLPKAVMIGDVEVHAPKTEPLGIGTRYFLADPCQRSLCRTEKWSDHNVDYRWLNKRLIHLTEDRAIQHAKAIIKLSGGKYE